MTDEIIAENTTDIVDANVAPTETTDTPVNDINNAGEALPVEPAAVPENIAADIPAVEAASVEAPAEVALVETPAVAPAPAPTPEEIQAAADKAAIHASGHWHLNRIHCEKVYAIEGNKDVTHITGLCAQIMQRAERAANWTEAELRDMWDRVEGELKTTPVSSVEAV